MQYVIYFALCGLGGFLFSFTDLSIAWMIGALFAGSLVALFQPNFGGLKHAVNDIPKSWFWVGQGILGVQLGLYVNMTLFETLSSYWLIIFAVLILSIIFAFLTGLLLFYFTNTDLLSSFIATAPGGVVAMPAYAQETGANVGTVSITQVLRIVLVIGTVPVLLSLNGDSVTSAASIQSVSYEATSLPLSFSQLGWTIALLALALLGILLARKLKIPTPWLLGAMITVAIFNIFFSSGESTAVLWWPDWALSGAQLFLGASIGAWMQRSLFRDAKAVIIVGTLSSLALIIALAACSLLVASVTQLDMATSILAFSPGGVAEMAATAVELGADSTFVVTVQVIRIMAVLLVLPPMFQILRKYLIKEEKMKAEA
ncbi:AbrB family transcriptional regulator [Natribacillus halophilus]|uniref:Membrane protein AbrB duplication n=1 Tax=Natribacillus halophilus TaxID=549003 RepID=A0A1G8KCP0_9BACI|nr:AbrB family transcriptional regulator [Natribacillus halophilus]SDI41178.1 hypothetical protein SAMN04488123_10225 [Natribacillus halophilus]